MKKLLITLIMGGYFSLPVLAQAPNDRYLMNPEIEQAIVKMRATNSNAELLQTLSALQGQKDQAAQVLLASTSLLDLEERNDIVAMIFRLPLDEGGINLTHIPLLVDLYVKSAQSPLPSKPRPRSFLNDSGLQSLLLDFIEALLDVESVNSTLPAGGPLPRLLGLLEAARGSSSLPATAQKMIKDGISRVNSVGNAGLDKPDAQHLPRVPKRAMEVKTMPKASEASPTTTVQNTSGNDTNWWKWVLAGLGVLLPLRIFWRKKASTQS